MTLPIRTPIRPVCVLRHANYAWALMHTAAVAVVLASAAWYWALRAEQARASTLRTAVEARCPRPERVDQITVTHPDGRCELIAFEGSGRFPRLPR